MKLLAARRAGVLLHPTSLPGPRRAARSAPTRGASSIGSRRADSASGRRCRSASRTRTARRTALRSAHAGDPRFIDAADLDAVAELPARHGGLGRPRGALRVVRGARDRGAEARVRRVRARAPPLARALWPVRALERALRRARRGGSGRRRTATATPRRCASVAPRAASSFARSCSSSISSSCSGQR